MIWRFSRHHRYDTGTVCKNVIHIVFSLIHGDGIGIPFKCKCHYHTIHIGSKDKQRIIGHTERLVHHDGHLRHRSELYLHGIHLHITSASHHHHIFTCIHFRSVGDGIGAAGSPIDGVAVQHPLVSGIWRGSHHPQCGVGAFTQFSRRGNIVDMNHGFHIHPEGVTNKTGAAGRTDLNFQSHLLYLIGAIRKRYRHAVDRGIGDELRIFSSLNNIPGIEVTGFVCDAITIFSGAHIRVTGYMSRFNRAEKHKVET